MEVGTLEQKMIPNWLHSSYPFFCNGKVMK